MKTHTATTLIRMSLAASILALTAGAALAQEALAQDASPSDASVVDEIIVTAQKRTENIQDVPISIAAFSQETLDEAGVTRVADLQRVAPGLQVTRGTQVANQRIQIRGVGTSGNNAVEPSVGLFLDGVYVPRPAALMGAFVDMAGVEVLRGPQGTLFGRNTTMGVLNLRTNAPDDVRDGSASVSAGAFDSYGGEFVYNLPISDTFALRLATAANRTDGPAENAQTGDTIGAFSDFMARLGARWDLTDTLHWVGRVDHLHIVSDGSPYSVLLASSMTPTAITNWQRALDPDGAAGPLVAPYPDIGDASTDRLSYFSNSRGDDTQLGLTSDLTWDFGDGWALRLINGFRDWRNEQTEGDVLLTPLDLAIRHGVFDSESQSNELQIISPEGGLFGGRFDFVAGLYNYQEDYLISDTTDFGASYCSVFIANTRGAPTGAACTAGPQITAGTNTLDQTTESWAVFGQGVVHLTGALNLVLGVRYTDESKEASYVSVKNNVADLTRANEITALGFEDTRTTYRVGLNWTPIEDVLVFGSYSTGYKAGGFESAAATTVLGQARVFDPETVENIELGARTAWLDNGVILNATVYRTTIDDFQIRSFDGIRFITRNAAQLRQQGVEFDTRWRIDDHWSATLAATYLDSEFLSYPNAPNLPGFTGTVDATGTRAGYSPEWQGNLGLTYEAMTQSGWRWQANGGLNFVAEQNVGSAGDNNPQNVQEAVQLFNARFSLFTPDDRFEFALLGTNIFDEHYCSTSFNQPFDQLLGLRSATTGFTGIRCTVGAPRFYGAELKARF